MNHLIKIEKGLVLILIFLIPTQLAIHLWPSWAFIFGIRIDYLSPTIYLTDVLVFIILSLWIFQDFKIIKKIIFKHKVFLTLFLILIILNTIFSTSIFPTLYKWIKILEFVFFAVYLSNSLKIIGKDLIFKTLFLSLIFFSLIGIDQFIIGKTIGGLLYFFGERSFTISTPGIALVKISGQDFLRAYSTFPHPNALAGYLGASTIFLFVNSFFKNNRNKQSLAKSEFGKRFFGLLIITGCFLLTFSLTAFLSLIIIILLKKHYSKFFILLILASLLMPIISDTFFQKFHFAKNISERLDLAKVSGKLISENFLMGTGLNTNLTFSRLLQPVHNIFLLTLSETGIFGLLFLVSLFHKSLKFSPLILTFIIITGVFDHYWLTLQQNLLLLSLISATLTSEWKKQV